MPYLNVGKENSGALRLYYEDHGSGRPVVLIHGWPLSGRSWEKQVPVLLDAGYRVITYDRRGFGDSSKPTFGHDYDTLARDLHQLLSQLNLKDVTLVGFSMGGGEVARYLSTHGSDRVSQAVFISAIPPFLLKTPDNAEGVDESVFETIKRSLTADRHAFLNRFLADFYNRDVFGDERISRDAVRFSWNIAAAASPVATLACVGAWLTDFRPDLSRISIPTLVIHGDSDRIVPLDASGKRTAALIQGARLLVIPDGPHGLTWTHSDKVNQDLLTFMASVRRSKGHAAA